jgi:hypothetical protein
LIFESNIIDLFSSEEDLFNKSKTMMKLCPLLFGEDHSYAKSIWEILTGIYILNFTILHLSSENELGEYN